MGPALKELMPKVRQIGILMGEFMQRKPSPETGRTWPTEINAPLLRAWATCAGDPAVSVVDWLDTTGLT